MKMFDKRFQTSAENGHQHTGALVSDPLFLFVPPFSLLKLQES